MKGFRLTAGLLVTATLITSLPVDVLASQSAESNKYMTGTSVSFSAGATAAINDTVILEDINSILSTDVEEQDAPVVAEGVKSAEDYANMAVAANISDYLNIRAEATTESEVVGKLYVNGVATVLETLDGWYKIESGNVIGYASADYLAVGDEEAIKAASERIATVTADTLRLRKEATTESGVYTLLSIGNKADVLDESIEGWVKVKYKSYEGYVSSEYVGVETVYECAESKEEERARLEAEEAERRRSQQAAQQAASSNKQQSSSSSNKTYNPPTGGSGQSVVDYAVQFVGNPYVWGGTSLTNGADCSGFIMSVYAAFGVSLPHSSYGLRSVGYAVDASQVQPGDIICYSGHVAIYIGNGAIVHASNKRDGIKISYDWQYKKVLAIRRIF